MKPSHRPPHVLIDNTNYFITASTVNHFSFFKSNEKIKILMNCFHKTVLEYKFEKIGWAFLPNHYHIILTVDKAGSLPSFINFFHGRSAYLINELEKCRGRKIWHQYWDRCIRTDKDFYTRLNYIHQNPVKHNFSATMQDYEWSSYKEWVNKIGQSGVDECFGKYPIVDFTLVEDI